MSAAFSTSTEVGMLDARTSLGSVTLPLTTDIPSRMITLKDVFGTAANSTITIKTQGSDLFEDGTTSKTMAANYDFMTLHAGSTNRWYIHATSLPPTMTMGSTITRFLSASNATISSINGAVPLLPANIASTIAGLGTAGFISTSQLTSSITASAFTGAINSISTGTLTTGSLTLTNQTLTLTNGTVAGVSTLAGATFTTAYNVTNFVGNGGTSATDGTGTNASVYYAWGLSPVDSNGTFYAADGNNKIRKITAAGVVTTLAGSGSAGTTDGTATNATFNNPIGLTFDTAGNVYVVDWAGHKVRMVTPAGVVTTLAGSGSPAFADGTGTNASFNNPWGIATDNLGNLYVVDRGTNRIRKIVIATGVVTTFAGNGGSSYTDGTGTNASFNSPTAISIDPATGTMIVVDGSKIRRVTFAGVVTTIAGNTTSATIDGVGTNASFNGPLGLAADSEGNIFVGEQIGYRVRKITPAGVVTTIAGSGSVATVNGIGASASFNQVLGVTIDRFGNIYAFDLGHYIRKLIPIPSNPFTSYTGSLNVSTIYANTGINSMRLGADYGVVTTFAGSGSGAVTNGTGTAASFSNPEGVVYDPVSNCLYASERGGGTIRKITLAGVVTTLASGFSGLRNGITVDPAGNVYVVDAGTNTLKKITSGGTVTTFAGSGTAASTDGTGTNAAFNNPYGLTCDPTGNYLYVSDASTNKIRRVTLAGAVVTTVAGTGSSGSTDGNALTTATFNIPEGLACDSAGNLYINDGGSNKIRKLSLAGIVTTVAGSGSSGGVDGVGTNATFSDTRGIVVDPVTNNLYVADATGAIVRKITPAGVVTTIAGQAGVNSTVNGLGSDARLNYPTDIAIDPAGNLYTTDTVGNTIRKITLATTLTNVIISTNAIITAPAVSTLALNISSINGQTPIGLSTMISTVAGLNSNISSMIDSTELTSSIIGLGTAGFISTATLTSTVIGLTNATSTVAATAFTGSTTSLSAATIYVSSLAANALTTSTLQVYNSINLTGGVMSNVASNFFTTPKFTTTFTPTNITGLKAWFDASQTTSITSNVSGQVFSWSNLAGFANATQAVASNTPVTGQLQINSLNTIQFNPTNEIKFGPISYTTASRAVFAVLVTPFNPSVTNKGTYIFGGQDDTMGTSGFHGYQFSGSGFEFQTSTGGNVSGVGYVTYTALANAGTFSATTAWLLSYHPGNGVFVNGTSNSSAANLGTGSLTDLFGSISQGFNVNTFYVAEFLQYDTAFSLSQRETVEGYLAWKWGIQSRLNVTNSYFSVPPPPLGTVYLAAGSVGTDASSNITIQATATTKISLAANTQVTGAFAASTISTSLLTSAQINVSSISTGTLTAAAASILNLSSSTLQATALTIPFSTLNTTSFFAKQSISSGTQIAYGTGGAYGQIGKYSQFYINDLKNQVGQTTDRSPTVLIEQDMAYLSTSSAVVINTYTSSTSFTVPAGITAIRVYMWGGGGGASGYQGGGGAFVCGSVAVTPGQVIQVAVNYGGGYNGYSYGGGLSGIFNTSITQANAIAIAGGGGSAGSGGYGGFGGITAGSAGYYNASPGGGGGGGTQTAAGAGSGNGSSGSGMQGGGNQTNMNGGAGGGGYFGGGGGGNNSIANVGGGGGSSYIGGIFSIFAESGTDGANGGFPGGRWAPFYNSNFGYGGTGLSAISGRIVLVYNTLPRMANLLELRTSFTPNITAITNTNTMGINVSSVTSSITLDVGGSARVQSLSSLTMNASTLNVNNLTILGTQTINSNGSLATSAYGSGVDTLALKTTLSQYNGGIASLFFGTSTLGYPLARIAALDGSISGPDSSALVFQTALASANANTSGVNVFQYTGANQSWTAPGGVTSVSVYLWGAAGGSAQAGNAGLYGGAGAFVSGTLTVIPGTTYNVIVGGAGQIGLFNGAGQPATFGGGGSGANAGGGNQNSGASGGGRSAIQVTLTVTATGTVSGGNIVYTTSGTHGLNTGHVVVLTNLSPNAFNITAAINAVTSNTFTVPNNTSATGSSSGTGTVVVELVDAAGGGGAGNSSGGVGTMGVYTSGTASGVNLIGGNGTNTGGGGGGGYYGGSGGGFNSGGGGGTSYTGSSVFTLVSGINSPNSAYQAPGTANSYYTAYGAASNVAAAVQYLSGGPGLVVIVSPPSSFLSETMRISNNGYLGIGTSSPTMLLDVAGTSRSQGMSTLSFNTSSINGIPFGAQALGVQTLTF